MFSREVQVEKESIVEELRQFESAFKNTEMINLGARRVQALTEQQEKEKQRAQKLIEEIPGVFQDAIKQGFHHIDMISTWGECEQEDIPCFFKITGSLAIVKAWAEREGFRTGVFVTTSSSDPDQVKTYHFVIAFP